MWPANAQRRLGRWPGEIAGKSAVSGQSWRPCPGPEIIPGQVMLEEWRPREGRPEPPAGRWGASPGVDPPGGCPMVPAPAAHEQQGPDQGPCCASGALTNSPIQIDKDHRISDNRTGYLSKTETSTGADRDSCCAASRRQPVSFPEIRPRQGARLQAREQPGRGEVDVEKVVEHVHKIEHLFEYRRNFWK